MAWSRGRHGDCAAIVARVAIRSSEERYLPLYVAGAWRVHGGGGTVPIEMKSGWVSPMPSAMRKLKARSIVPRPHSQPHATDEREPTCPSHV